jgi:hypothetical protein
LDRGCLNYRCIFLDFSSAFNTISRQAILEKFSIIGIPKWVIAWIADYFQNCFQFVTANGRKSSSIPNNHGVLQGAVLSPALFSILTDSLTSNNSNLILKYADDSVIAGQLKSADDFKEFETSIEDMCSWSRTNNLILNKAKCVECDFSLQRRATVNHPRNHSSIDGSVLSTATNVKYLGIIFSSDCTWSSHITNVFSKCLKLIFVIKRLVKLHVSYDIIRTFVNSCVLPVILYCSPVIFPGLLAKDLEVLRRAIKLISRSSGINFSALIDSISTQHFRASLQFAHRILADSNHPLFPHLSQSSSRSSSRSSFKLIYSRTSTFRRSVVPFLARLLSNENAVIEHFKSLLNG